MSLDFDINTYIKSTRIPAKPPSDRRGEVYARLRSNFDLWASVLLNNASPDRGSVGLHVVSTKSYSTELVHFNNSHNIILDTTYGDLLEALNSIIIIGQPEKTILSYLVQVVFALAGFNDETVSELLEKYFDAENTAPLWDFEKTKAKYPVIAEYIMETAFVQELFILAHEICHIREYYSPQSPADTEKILDQLADSPLFRINRKSFAIDFDGALETITVFAKLLNSKEVAAEVNCDLAATEMIYNGIGENYPVDLTFRALDFGLRNQSIIARLRETADYLQSGGHLTNAKGPLPSPIVEMERLRNTMISQDFFSRRVANLPKEEYESSMATNFTLVDRYNYFVEVLMKGKLNRILNEILINEGHRLFR